MVGAVRFELIWSNLQKSLKMRYLTLIQASAERKTHSGCGMNNPSPNQIVAAIATIVRPIVITQ
jgi:hypothetical protein